MPRKAINLLNCSKLIGCALYPFLYLTSGTLAFLLGDQKNVRKYEQMTYRFNEWCREGGRTPTTLRSADFESPKNTVSL